MRLWLRGEPAELEQVRARSRRATQAINAGETIRFGGISMSSTGLARNGHFLPFADIVRIHHDRDTLYCQLHAGAVAVSVAIGLHRVATGRR
jgi:hypothetical protein